MEEKINVVEILKDKPVNTKLWSPLFGDVYTSSICSEDTIIIVNHHAESSSFYNNGKYFNHAEAEPLLFPSNEMRDWSKFAWKKGDILVNKDAEVHIIFDGFKDDTYKTFHGHYYLWEEEGSIVNFEENEDYMQTSEFYKANKEEAQTYINTIEERLGGKLNRESLKVEKTQPEFKDGDIAFADYGNRQDVFIVSDKTGLSEGYSSFISLDLSSLTLSMGYRTCFFKKDLCKLRLATDSEKKQLFSALEKEGKAWDAEKKQIVDLKPKCEFKPMDLCLMKYIGQYNNRGWELCQYAYTEHRVSSSGEHRDFYHSVGGEIYAECIPYNEDTKHLLGTKTEWKGGEQ
jgi:hypothetical protein